jgi:nicotinate phosphoribosyltransferase
LSVLLNDSYKMVMTYSFFQNNMQNDHTAFELLFRKCPFGGQYVIFAGLEEVANYIKNFKFTEHDIEYV